MQFLSTFFGAAELSLPPTRYDEADAKEKPEANKLRIEKMGVGWGAVWEVNKRSALIMGLRADLRRKTLHAVVLSLSLFLLNERCDGC
jgi:hypothetical protein